MDLVTGGSGVDPNYKEAAPENHQPRSYPFTWWEIPVALIGLLAIVFALVWHLPGLVLVCVLCLSVLLLRLAPRGFLGGLLFYTGVILAVIVFFVAIILMYSTRV